MKALSIINPWAWAIVNLPEPRAKRIENRPWFWHRMIGQRFAIHVSKSTYDDVSEKSFVYRGLMTDAQRIEAREQRGFIIGTAVNSAVVVESDDPWFEGPYGLVLRDVLKLDHPIVARGQRLWWDVSPEIAAAISLQEAHQRENV